MAAKSIYSQEGSCAPDHSYSSSKVLTKPVQPVENSGKLSAIILGTQVQIYEDDLMKYATLEEKKFLIEMFQDLSLRAHKEPQRSVSSQDSLREALNAAGKKLPVQKLRRYVRCLYHETTKLTSKGSSVRICAWAVRPSDWPPGVPFMDPNNSSSTKRANKHDLQAMFDYLIGKYKKMDKENDKQVMAEESMDLFPSDEFSLDQYELFNGNLSDIVSMFNDPTDFQMKPSVQVAEGNTAIKGPSNNDSKLGDNLKVKVHDTAVEPVHAITMKPVHITSVEPVRTIHAPPVDSVRTSSEKSIAKLSLMFCNHMHEKMLYKQAQNISEASDEWTENRH